MLDAVSRERHLPHDLLEKQRLVLRRHLRAWKRRIGQGLVQPGLGARLLRDKLLQWVAELVELAPRRVSANVLHQNLAEERPDMAHGVVDGKLEGWVIHFEGEKVALKNGLVVCRAGLENTYPEFGRGAFGERLSSIQDVQGEHEEEF